MPDSIVTTGRPWADRVVLAIAALVPLVLCAALSWHEAGRRQYREADLAARFIENQVGFIVTEARAAARELAPLTGQPCAQLMPDLMRRAAVVPYLRSLNVIEHDRIACSSALGTQSSPLASFGGAPDHAPERAWTRLITSTPMVPHRPALLVGEPAPGGRTVLAIVDDRYLLDLLHAVAPPDIFQQVALRVGDGLSFGQTPQTSDGGASRLLIDSRVEMAGTPVELRIYGLRERRVRVWIELLQRFMPFALLLSGVLAWLGVRVQKSRGSLREQLLAAIRTNQFHVEYQPLYGVPERRCHGVEALLRWNRPGIGPVSPDAFIEAAEETHVIVPLTLHLLKLIARDVRTWNTPPGFHLGINFAAEHLSGDRFLDDLRPFLADISVCRLQLVLEITERSLMRNTQQARYNLDTLRAQGAKVAIDDFGTGYCSLSYLEKFPFDLMKVDRGFVMTIDPQHGEAIVLDAIISLAHRLKAQVVAEGVDQPIQFGYLRARGVSFMQGYLYAKPMPSDEFVAWHAAFGQRPYAGGDEAAPGVADNTIATG
ncbi:EAL domain-containing protein [Paraburkholderia caballeronis]|uniref:cyclic-guanylate-specific phosphodiesterase n=1 Tax=Paraburkholderia caballeronis TaxID=416943 RepID=A0A1H7LFL6_9BURK|nr:EAL domain-containing protein [Paraburkholderia caballeronis]PXW28427.1 EAL domain-containing protein (putative c-di-GMP-specific phosphodiesterase class I) [Paraburkholderia caballeronis]PXX03793.1 EAL domain-containing protein (putative c-di-GMP-specific phosphodiesterase class I) [Paraburkholderia caballeronis]RAK04537.1 EAL domain-containing protein (putative c-di-GMP-specific phosphodiesterase class I) [Paraburkholderia caballeronis]TDV19442.1 EAL domain-containing protein (putative c-d